jgi:hypothetical protein
VHLLSGLVHNGLKRKKIATHIFAIGGGGKQGAGRAGTLSKQLYLLVCYALGLSPL